MPRSLPGDTTALTLPAVSRSCTSNDGRHGNGSAVRKAAPASDPRRGFGAASCGRRPLESTSDEVLRHAVDAAGMDLADRRVFVVDGTAWARLQGLVAAQPAGTGNDAIQGLVYARFGLDTFHPGS